MGRSSQAFPRYLTAVGLLQYYGALSLTAYEEIQRRIPELLERVGLSDRSQEPVARFSKGMVQRLSLAQALINDPELLVLDEPNEGLDLSGRQLVRDVIAEYRQRGRTVLAGVHPAHLDAPGDVPSVEVRDQSAGGAHQRGLAGARQPAHHRELPVGELQLDAAQRRPGGAGVAVGQALDPQGAHRTTPR